MELDEADEMVKSQVTYICYYPDDIHGSLAKVSQMEIEIQGVPQSARAQYHSRLRSAKADLSKYKKLLAESRSQLARSSLLSSTKLSENGAYGSSDDPYGSSDRTRLLNGTMLLEDGTRRLQQSQQIALETENQGAEILSNLRIQREQIENSRDTVRCFCLHSHVAFVK
jgi:vesicle transport through interaction with t-SNAREs 1